MDQSRSWQSEIEINRNSIRPLYLQVKEALEEWILTNLRDGTLAPGDRLPSENQLSDQLGVSSITVKRSLDELRRQGLIQRIQGRGSFVGQPKMVLPLQRLFSLTTLTKDYGMQPLRRVLEIHEAVAKRGIAHHLSIPEGDRLVRLVRLRLMDKLPVAVETSFLPLQVFPGLLSEYSDQISLYDLLKERYHREIVRADDILGPVLINAYESRALEVPLGTLGILLERTGYDSQNTPLEYTKSVFRGDLCRFSMHFDKETV